MKKLFLVAILLAILVMSASCANAIPNDSIKNVSKYNEQGYLITKITDQILLVETDNFGYESFHRALFEVSDNFTIKDIDIIHNSYGQFYKAFIVIER